MKTRLEQMLLSTDSWMDRFGQRLIPWLLIGNLILLSYLTVVTRDARDGAWSSEDSASTAASNSDDSNSKLADLDANVEAIETNLRRMRADVDQINMTLMFRSR